MYIVCPVTAAPRMHCLPAEKSPALTVSGNGATFCPYLLIKLLFGKGLVRSRIRELRSAARRALGGEALSITTVTVHGLA